MKKFLSIIAFVAISGVVFGQQLTLSLSSTNVTCNGTCNGTATVSVAGGTAPYTYMWNNDSIFSQTATGLCVGTHTVVVYDANQNSATGTVTIHQPTAISVNLTTQNPTTNGGSDGSITSSVTGGTPPYVYLWSTGATTANIYHLPSGIYTLYITDANGCSSSYTVQLFDQNSSTCQAYFYAYIDTITVPPMTVYNFVDQSVADSSSTITTYLWDFGDGSSSNASNPNHVFSSGFHTICLTIATSGGCTSTYCDSIYVNGNNTSTCQANFYSYPDSINVPPMQQYNFVDLSVPDSTSTIISYSWTFPGGTPATSTSQNPMGIVFQAPGTYTICLTIATSSGCSSNYCETITVGNNGCQLYANITTQSPTTIGGSDGFIESNVYGGTAPYSYSWSNSATTPNIYHLTSGYYTLSVTDANGCQNIFYAELYEPYDTTGGNIVDTLYTGILDSCLNFIPDSFYIASITTDPNSNIVSVVWVFVGSGQTATFTVTYTFSQYGNTLVVITLNCGTKTLTTYQSYIHITNTSSVPIYGDEQNLFIYPVPFSDKLNIGFTTQRAENVNILLIDASGRVLVTKKISSNYGVNSAELNTSQLSSGVYILNIETSNGIIRKQIVK